MGSHVTLTSFSGLRRKLQKWRRKIAEVVVPVPATGERLGDEDYEELFQKLKPRLGGRFVPITVGRIDDDDIVPAAENFSVRAVLLKQACMADLLRESKQQFEYIYGGVFRIPCDPDEFRRVVEKAGYDDMVSFVGYAV